MILTIMSYNFLADQTRSSKYQTHSVYTDSWTQWRWCTCSFSSVETSSFYLMRTTYIHLIIFKEHIFPYQFLRLWLVYKCLLWILVPTVVQSGDGALLGDLLADKVWGSDRNYQHLLKEPNCVFLMEILARLWNAVGCTFYFWFWIFS